MQLIVLMIAKIKSPGGEIWFSQQEDKLRENVAIPAFTFLISYTCKTLQGCQKFSIVFCKNCMKHRVHSEEVSVLHSWSCLCYISGKRKKNDPNLREISKFL